MASDNGCGGCAPHTGVCSRVASSLISKDLLCNKKQQAEQPCLLLTCQCNCNVCGIALADTGSSSSLHHPAAAQPSPTHWRQQGSQATPGQAALHLPQLVFQVRLPWPPAQLPAHQGASASALRMKLIHQCRPWSSQRTQRPALCTIKPHLQSGQAAELNGR